MYVIKARMHGCVRNDSETHSTGVTGLHSRLRCHFAHTRVFSLVSHTCVLAIYTPGKLWRAYCEYWALWIPWFILGLAQITKISKCFKIVYTEFRRKFYPNLLVWPTVLLALGHRAMGYVDPWSSFLNFDQVITRLNHYSIYFPGMAMHCWPLSCPESMPLWAMNKPSS